MELCPLLALTFFIWIVSGSENCNEDGTFQIRTVEFQKMQKRMKILEEMVEKQTAIIRFQGERIDKLEMVSGLGNPDKGEVSKEIKDKFGHNIPTSLLWSTTTGFHSNGEEDKEKHWQFQRGKFD
jgi:hypothetical protein